VRAHGNRSARRAPRPRAAIRPARPARAGTIAAGLGRRAKCAAQYRARARLTRPLRSWMSPRWNGVGSAASGGSAYRARVASLVGAHAMGEFEDLTAQRAQLFVNAGVDA